MSDDTETWEHPDKLTIPCPMAMSKKRGIFAKKDDDFPTSVRLTPSDKILIETEARHLGLGYSAFMRWCAVQCARELAFARTGVKPNADF